MLEASDWPEYAVVVESSTVIDKRIHSEGEVPFFRTARAVGAIRYAFDEEQIDPQQHEQHDQHGQAESDLSGNFIILEFQGERDTVTSLSDSWQVHNMKVDEWQFEQEKGNSVRAVGILLRGSSSEMIVEDSERYDLLPKPDIAYADKLADLFTVRSEQLSNIIS